MILLFGAVFTILYAHGKLRAWIALAREKGITGVLGALAVTLPIQTILAGLVFFIGYGLGAVIDPSRTGAGALSTFDWALAGGLLAVCVPLGLLIHWLEGGTKGEGTLTNVVRGGDAGGDEVGFRGLDMLCDEAEVIGRQSVIMPSEIFSLARKFADHPDRVNAIRAIDDQLLDDDSAFVRRVGLTALRFMGPDAGVHGRETVIRAVLDRVHDDNPWVRYDAAWLAGVVPLEPDAFANALRSTLASAGIDAAAQPGTGAAERPAGDAAEAKAVERALESLALLERASAEP